MKRAFPILFLSALLAPLPGFTLSQSDSVTRALRCWSPSDEVQVCEAAEGVFVVVDKAPVASNSLVVFGGGGSCLIVDTPWTEEATQVEIGWIEDTMGALPPTTAVTTHFHLDRLGGNGLLKKLAIPIHGSQATCDILAAAGNTQKDMTGKSVPVTAPDHLFDPAVGETLDLDGEEVILFYPGGGHTKDNIVVYLPKRRVLFGGCLIKSLAAKDKGNVADADLAHWADSVRSLKARFPEAQVVIPGHGDPGGPELLDHTIDLLK
jgi:glyoxylase-like metal-dependent hydrolase (beta-lactamase superfamily II)